MTNFHESFRRDMYPPSERGTGLVFAGVAFLVAALSYRNPAVWAPALAVSFTFGIMSLFAPAVLKPLNMLWFRLSMLLYRVFNPAIMFLIFVIVIVPAGTIMQLIRDPLQTHRTRDRQTYWLSRSSGPKTGSMEQQF